MIPFIGGIRIIHSEFTSAIPQARQAALTALYRDTALPRTPSMGMPPYSDRLISGYRFTQTAIYRDAAILKTTLYRDMVLLRPPYIGILPYSDRLISGYRLNGGPLLYTKKEVQTEKDTPIELRHSENTFAKKWYTRKTLRSVLG